MYVEFASTRLRLQIVDRVTHVKLDCYAHCVLLLLQIAEQKQLKPLFEITKPHKA